MKRTDFSKLGLVLASVLALSACGGNGDGDDSGSSSGTVREPWTDFCTAIFMTDTEIRDPFDDPMFTARAGEEYLLSDFNTSFAEFVYLTDVGPDEFTIDADASGDWPFYSNCNPGAGVRYYAVFTDVTVYAEETLTTRICDLAAGTALPSVGGGGFVTAGGFSLDGPATYEIFLDAFSAQCGGNESGFISVPQTQSLGVTTWLVPIIGIIGPE